MSLFPRRDGTPFGQDAAAGAAASSSSARNPAQAGAPGPGETLLVASPKFKLQYAIDDAGPSGPATVELWITQDGGRTWIRRGDDPDRVSPIEVDLGGEGTFGLCLVARSASGLGDQPPAPGDPPQSWVEVDSTAPVVQLKPAQVGTGANSGKVAIAWRASDLHLPPRSVSLSWRPDQPGAEWQTIADGLENAGQFVWTVPATVPSGSTSRSRPSTPSATAARPKRPTSGPIIVDRSRPRSRIIGLDPNARPGQAPRRGRSGKPRMAEYRKTQPTTDRGNRATRRPEQVLDGVALADELGGRGVEPLSGVVVDRQAGDDRPVGVSLGDQREAVDQAGRDAVAAVGDDAGAEPVARGRGRMDERTLSTAALAAEAADDAPRALITAPPRLATVGMYVSANQAGSVITGRGRLAADPGVLVVGILGVAVIAPDRHVRDRADRHARLLGELRGRPVLVEPGHREPALGRDSGAMRPGDQAVGVAGVGDGQDPDVRAGGVVDRLALAGEDRAVGADQVGARLPSLRGRPPTRITQSAPSNASSALSVAFTSVSSGKAQSSSSIIVPFSAGSAGVISSSCSATG